MRRRCSASTDSFLRPEDIAQGRVPTALFGCYTNALTLFTIVPAMTQAFGISALPNVTAAWAGGSRVKLEHSVENVLRISRARHHAGRSGPFRARRSDRPPARL